MTAGTDESLNVVHSDGVAIACRVWSGSGTPIVFIHGLTGNHMHAAGLAHFLDGRHPLVAMDLRGRGASDKPVTGYGLAQHARDVAAVIADLGWRECTVVGHSMGAYVAAELASSFPDLVGRTVLLDGGLAQPSPFGLLTSTMCEILARAYVAELRSSERRIANYHRQITGTEWQEARAWLEPLLAYDLADNGRPRVSDQAVHTDFLAMADRDASKDRLRRIRGPVAVVRAQHGIVSDWWPLMEYLPIITRSVVGEIRRCSPNATDVLMRGANHYSIAVGPQVRDTTEVVANFARQLA